LKGQGDKKLGDLFVLDASVLINLLGCGNPKLVLKALSARCMVEDHVIREVTRHPIDGHDVNTTFSELLSLGLIHQARLDDASYEVFLSLVAGSPLDSLGQGESATLALAASLRGAAVLDDGKARRIAEKRFAQLSLATSVTLFRIAAKKADMNTEQARTLVGMAIQNSRMRVLPEDRKWVDSLGL
jgi:predicted nucleic acid-binding protein